MKNSKCSVLAATLTACLLFVFAPINFAQAASVVTKTKTFASDTAITTEIKSKFLVEKSLDSFDIKVKTTKGIVTLRGQVESGFQSRLAEKIAREVKGVRGVNNRISVLQHESI